MASCPRSTSTSSWSGCRRTEFEPWRGRFKAIPRAICGNRYRGNRQPAGDWSPLVHLAGLPVKELVLDESADGGGGCLSSDLASATRIATEMEASHGLGDSLVHPVPNGSRQVQERLLADRSLRRCVEAALDKAYENLREILEENEPAHQALVDALMHRHKLDGKEVLEFVSGPGDESQRTI